MTDRDIMQQALDALLQSATKAPFGADSVVYVEGVKIHKAAIAALNERLAQPEQEPVARVCYGAPGKRDIDFEEADINGLPIGTSLYTTPPAVQPATEESSAVQPEQPAPQPEQQEQRYSPLDGGMEVDSLGDWVRFTPQRTWVGLTDEDRQAAFESMPDMLEGFLKTWGWLHFSKALEAKLKEKNT